MVCVCVVGVWVGENTSSVQYTAASIIIIIAKTTCRLPSECVCALPILINPLYCYR